MYEALAQVLKNSRNIVFFGGAGVSTESGIPDFRSEAGSFKALQKYGHAPEELLSIGYFTQNPEVFYQYHLEFILHPEAQPNAAHTALAALERAGRLKAVVTQNIDGLHQMAGSGTVYELHGSVARNYCTGCGAKYSLEYLRKPASRRGSVPLCTACGGIVRPDVVLYGEMLDPVVMEGAAGAIKKADTLIVGGTSLVVYPAAGLVHCFRGNALVLINRSKTPFDDQAQLVIHDSIGAVLDEAVRLAGF